MSAIISANCIFPLQQKAFMTLNRFTVCRETQKNLTEKQMT